MYPSIIKLSSNQLKIPMATNQLLDNRYQIIKKLHETHVSITFVGKDTRSSNRLCLIKQLKTSKPQLQQELEQRFQQEAKILKRLGKHPQIPDLYGYFSEDNKFYLVQEWMAGRNLQHQLKQKGKLTEIEVKDILKKILPALDFFKENKIIHRDIKPSNIMVNGEKLSILIDFGMVKEIDTIVNPNMTYTVLGIGTSGFVSPEQKKGKPTHASDIYSLGITAVYLLTGKIPSGKLPWRKNVPNISSKFADILGRAIEKKLSDRYQTATEMLTAIKSSKTFYQGNNQLLKIGIVATIIGIIGAGIGIFFNKAENYYNGMSDRHNQGAYEEALAEYNQAIQLNPKYAEAYNNRGYQQY